MALLQSKAVVSSLEEFLQTKMIALSGRDQAAEDLRYREQIADQTTADEATKTKRIYRINN